MKHLIPPPQQIAWPVYLGAVASTIAAVATLGALLVAIRVLLSDRHERARAEVRKVRAWIEPRDPSWVNGQASGTSKLATSSSDAVNLHIETTNNVLGMTIENATDEFIYNVKARAMSPVLTHGSEWFLSTGSIPPGGRRESDNGMEIEHGRWFQHDYEGFSGVEVFFTDGRGVRWTRDHRGVLRVCLKVRWWTPWRYTPLTEVKWDRPPWWEFGSKWHYRNSEAESLASAKLPVPWYAFDFKWKRWKSVRVHVPWPASCWHPLRRWKVRKQLCSQRFEKYYAVPFFAIDEWFRYRRWVNGVRKDEREVESRMKESLNVGNGL
jgi:hypothetical protein